MRRLGGPLVTAAAGVCLRLRLDEAAGTVAVLVTRS